MLVNIVRRRGDGERVESEKKQGRADRTQNKRLILPGTWGICPWFEVWQHQKPQACPVLAASWIHTLESGEERQIGPLAREREGITGNFRLYLNRSHT